MFPDVALGEDFLSLQTFLHLQAAVLPQDCAVLAVEECWSVGPCCHTPQRVPWAASSLCRLCWAELCPTAPYSYVNLHSQRATSINTNWSLTYKIPCSRRQKRNTNSQNVKEMKKNKHTKWGNPLWVILWERGYSIGQIDQWYSNYSLVRKKLVIYLIPVEKPHNVTCSTN